jgi:pyruvate dehydrogenase phosphatase
VSGGAEGLSRRSEEDVDEIVSKNHDVLLKGMRGTTALVALVDASKENLWIANVGDCVAGVFLSAFVFASCYLI